MFLPFSDTARIKVAQLRNQLGDDDQFRATLAQATRIAWDRLGPEADYQYRGRTLRRGQIEPQDIDAALSAI